MSSVKKNFIYNSAYQILLILLPLVTTPYLSRILGPKGIGIYSYDYSVAYYFGIFILLGLNNYGNRKIAQVRDDSNLLSRAFWSIYTMQFALGFIVCLLYLLCWVVLLNRDQIYCIMFLYVVSNVFDINWLYFGLEKFRYITIRNIIVKVLTTVAIFTFVKHEEDVWVYAVIMVGSMLLSQLVLWPHVLRSIKFAKPKIMQVIVHLKPNMLLFLTVLATSIFKIMDKIMLGSMTSKIQVGFYESSERVIAIPIALIVSLGTVMLPRMSNLVANNKDNDTQAIIGKSVIFALFLSSSICFGIMGVSDLFVPLFYGTGYEMCIALYKILLPSCLFLAFANVIRTQFIIPRQMDRIYVVSAFLGAAVNLTVNYLLIPSLKASGAAIGTLIAEIVVCFYQCYKVRAYLPIKKYILCGLPYVFSGIGMFFLLQVIHVPMKSAILCLAVQIIMGALLYFIFLFIQEMAARITVKKSLLMGEYYHSKQT